MKTIIVATDFSDAAENAINYAAEMALQLKARRPLFAPVITHKSSGKLFAENYFTFQIYFIH